VAQTSPKLVEELIPKLATIGDVQGDRPGFLSLEFALLAGALILAGFSITVVLAQELWFERRALASGLIVGFAFGMGGLLVPGVGTIADVYGLRTALLSVGFLALLPLVLTAVVGWLLSPGNADRREGTVS